MTYYPPLDGKTNAELAHLLKCEADDLIDEIDGGEDCRNEDSRRTMRAALMERAARALEKT